MSKLITKDKDIVVPGEVLAEGMDYLPGIGTYRDGEKILASKLGLINVDGRAISLSHYQADTCLKEETQ